MFTPLTRRTFLLAAAALPFVSVATVRAGESIQATTAQTRLEALEQEAGGRLGVYALDTGSGEEIRFRADERFPMCSTFKVMLAAAVLARSVQHEELLVQRIAYSQDDLVSYSPISAPHAGEGMTVAELCAAALQYSDNTAANVLMRLLGGPQAVTAYARSIGNKAFRLDRWETALNSAMPGDVRDSVTPEAMAYSLRALVLGKALPESQRQQLGEWLKGNTTGAKRIRAAVPAAWQVGDKTGSGDYGTANDIAVLWPPGRKPVVVAVYHTQRTPDATWRDEVVTGAARVVVETFR